jgi:hypothetical protein
MDFLRNSNPPYLQAHCQSRTSQPADQSFVKELAKPLQVKLFLKNFPTLPKNKKRNAQPNRQTKKTQNDTQTLH